MANTLLNSQGSTPNWTPPTSAFGAALGTTPQSKALSGGSFTLPNATPPPPVSQPFAGYTVPQPTTPVTSFTQTNPDGSSTKTTHAKPDTGSTSGGTSSGLLSGASGGSTTTPTPAPAPLAPNDPSYKYNTATGALNPNYPGYVAPGTETTQGAANTLAGVSSAGSATTPGLISQTAGYGAGNIPIGQNASAITSNYGNLIQGILKGSLGQGLGDITSGGTLPVGIGAQEAAVTAGGNAIQGLTQQEQQALAGNAQGLTAANQAATAANQAAGQSNTAQGLVQSGLNSAGNLAAPGTQLGILGQGQTAVNGQGQPVTSTGVIAPVGTQAQYGVPATTYGANGQPNTAVSGAANGSGSSNTPFTGGQAAGEAALGETYKQNQAAIASLPGIQQKINTDISQNGINNLSSVNIANAVNDWVQGNMSNPNLANFYQDLTDFTQTVAPLIGIGGSMTDMKTAIAGSLISPSMSGATITSALSNLYNLAINKNQGVAEAGQGGTGTAQGTGSTSGTTTAGGYTYVQNPTTGQWSLAQ